MERSERVLARATIARALLVLEYSLGPRKMQGLLIGHFTDPIARAGCSILKKIRALALFSMGYD